MAPITAEYFQEWLEAYSRASIENNPHASAKLFAANAEYYENPFAEPMIGRNAIYDYWENGARTLTDKESDHEILSVVGNLGIARWQARFTVINSGKRITLDCIFLVEFDEDMKCRRFREWWHSQVTEASSNDNSA